MFRKLLTGGVVAAIGLSAYAGTAAAATVKGTVVHHNKRAHSFVVADARGRLSAIHATRSPALGSAVTIAAHKLRNGTFAADRMRVGKKRHHVRIHGRVTYANRAGHWFVVSARGASLVVHAARAHPTARRARAAADVTPTPGTVVTVDGSVDQEDAISADTVENDGQSNNSTDLEGVVLAIDTAGHTLTLSVDDNNDTSTSVIVHLPAGFALDAYKLGDEAQFVATPNPDGSYTAVGSSKDGGTQEADDTQEIQGHDNEVGDGQKVGPTGPTGPTGPSTDGHSKD
jgi:hypothetical protein